MQKVSKAEFNKS